MPDAQTKTPWYLIRSSEDSDKERLVKAIVASTLGAQRVWMPMKPVASYSRTQPRLPQTFYPDNETYPVHVVIGDPVRRVQEYDNWAHFQKAHDFEDYPIKKMATAAEITCVQVADHSGEGLVAVRSAGVPRQANMRDLIWRRADELWASAGSPKDVPTVLKLRKQWMDLLEKEGLKRTTLSGELGNWQKDRVLK
jgi:hypothetical protein